MDLKFGTSTAAKLCLEMGCKFLDTLSNLLNRIKKVTAFPRFKKRLRRLSLK
jgi:hypothetical protein